MKTIEIIRVIAVFAILIICSSKAIAQMEKLLMNIKSDSLMIYMDSVSNKIYHLNHEVELPITVEFNNLSYKDIIVPGVIPYTKNYLYENSLHLCEYIDSHEAISNPSDFFIIIFDSALNVVPFAPYNRILNTSNPWYAEETLIQAISWRDKRNLSALGDNYGEIARYLYNNSNISIPKQKCQRIEIIINLTNYYFITPGKYYLSLYFQCNKKIFDYFILNKDYKTDIFQGCLQSNLVEFIVKPSQK
ncbi:MAG: hypothetical protein JXB17_08215 [Bacteroidales bacterium]|nr:hypothetical protein [Bacteroidales bacterium]